MQEEDFESAREGANDMEPQAAPNSFLPHADPNAMAVDGGAADPAESSISAQAPTAGAATYPPFPGYADGRFAIQCLYAPSRLTSCQDRFHRQGYLTRPQAKASTPRPIHFSMAVRRRLVRTPRHRLMSNLPYRLITLVTLPLSRCPTPTLRPISTPKLRETSKASLRSNLVAQNSRMSLSTSLNERSPRTQLFFLHIALFWPGVPTFEG